MMIMKTKTKEKNVSPCMNLSLYGALKIVATTLLLLSPSCNAALVDITEYIMDGINDGVLVAFGDYNADKSTDLFIMTANRKDVYLIVASKNQKMFTRKMLLSSSASEGTITGIMPGDFNGDSLMDILVTRKSNSTNAVTVQIYWTESDGESYTVKNHTNLEDELTDEPLLMDYNGDMIPDLFAEDQNDKKRYYWVGSTAGKFQKVEQKLPKSPTLYQIRSPNSNAFVNLGSNLTADLFVTTYDEKSSTFQFEKWISQYSGLEFDDTISKPHNSGQVIGQSSFVDLDGDSLMDMLLPVCLDSTCADSSIYVYMRNQWYLLADSFVNRGIGWGFAPPDHGENLPLTLRTGDFDLDGYPDVLAVFKSVNDKMNAQKAFILLNVACVQDSCKSVGRTLQVQYDTPLQDVSNVTAAAFYDISGNGIPDVLVQTWDDKNQPKIMAFQNGFHQDACFMKVMVVSGLCYYDCPGGRLPYVTLPGVTISYHTTGSDGNLQRSISGQLSQSAHFPLQLPYTVFGLGLTPNFVDALEVGIPRGVNASLRKREWTSIIPNAQLIILPHPPNEPKSWINKLFVSPLANHQVIYTAAALLGTCVFVSGIIGALQWRERAEDKKEKLQDAQKFHFDAM